VGASSCYLCPEGTFGVAAGFSSISVCYNCAVGSYSANKGTVVCDLCPAGKYGSNVGVSSINGCQNCPAGTASAYAGFTSMGACTPCARGFFNPSAGQPCQACAAGKYSGTTGASTVDVCLSCAVGKYGPSAGATSVAMCQTANAGYFVSTVGMPVQSFCPAGTYSATTGASSVTVCQPCLTGKYSSNLAATSAATCVDCPCTVDPCSEPYQVSPEASRSYNDCFSPAIGVSVGDPIVVGFRGQHFEVIGVDGGWYTWYSDLDLKIYCRLDSPAGRDAGQYITAVYVYLGVRQIVSFSVWPKFNNYIRVGRKTRSSGAQPRVWEDGCGVIKFLARSTLNIVWQQYDISITRRTLVQNGNQKLLKNGEKPIFLNIAMGITHARSPHNVDGILGRTLRVVDIPAFMPAHEVERFRLNVDPGRLRPRMMPGLLSNIACVMRNLEKHPRFSAVIVGGVPPVNSSFSVAPAPPL